MPIESRLNPLIRFGDFTLDRANETLTRNGAPVALQPQPMKVLLLLIDRSGQLVTRKELQQAVWGSDTFVDFEQGLNWCIRRIREVLGDDANQPRFIQTIPRKGYRFLITSAPPQKLTSRWLAIAAIAIISLGVGVARERAVTVVVLPFDNYAGNELLADITTEEVINRVGSIDPSRIKVIDRLTAMKFKRTNECIIHIGRQLGADFVMEGAVQKSRTTAALYRVADNTQVWATAAAPPEIAAKVANTFSSKFNRP